MEALLKAVTDFLTAILARLGYVGRPRRRENLKEELELLSQFRDAAEFGPQSKATTVLRNHIETEVARYAGIDKRKRPWSGVTLALLIGIPLAYLTFKLNEDGFDVFSLLPGLGAALMLFACIGMLTEDKSSAESPSTQAPASGDPSP